MNPIVLTNIKLINNCKPGELHFLSASLSKSTKPNNTDLLKQIPDSYTAQIYLPFTALFTVPFLVDVQMNLISVTL